jgi:hypothetical protein
MSESYYEYVSNRFFGYASEKSNSVIKHFIRLFGDSVTFEMVLSGCGIKRISRTNLAKFLSPNYKIEKADLDVFENLHDTLTAKDEFGLLFRCMEEKNGICLEVPDRKIGVLKSIDAHLHKSESYLAKQLVCWYEIIERDYFLNSYYVQANTYLLYRVDVQDIVYYTFFLRLPMGCAKFRFNTMKVFKVCKDDIGKLHCRVNEALEQEISKGMCSTKEFGLMLHDTFIAVDYKENNKNYYLSKLRAAGITVSNFDTFSLSIHVYYKLNYKIEII